MKNTLSKIKKILIQYNHIFFIILVFLSMGYFYLIHLPHARKNTLKHSKYTIATIISDWHHRNDNGYGYDYDYFINGKRYRKTSNNVHAKKGERRLIMYDSLNPNHHCFLGYYELHDSITTPKNGWKYEQVPIAIDSAEIREYIEKWK